MNVGWEFELNIGNNWIVLTNLSTVLKKNIYTYDSPVILGNSAPEKYGTDDKKCMMMTKIDLSLDAECYNSITSIILIFLFGR